MCCSWIVNFGNIAIKFNRLTVRNSAEPQSKPITKKRAITKTSKSNMYNITKSNNVTRTNNLTKAKYKL